MKEKKTKIRNAIYTFTHAIDSNGSIRGVGGVGSIRFDEEKLYIP